MVQKQKEMILALLKSNEANKNYKKGYCFSFEDFLDPTDNFTDFSGENLEGKQEYIVLIENLLRIDENAKVFVEVYGFEQDDNDEFIYADTLIIFSTLPFFEIKRVFNESKDIFPSDVGEYNDFSSQKFVIDDKGNFFPIGKFFDRGYSVYYCWWD